MTTSRSGLPGLLARHLRSGGAAGLAVSVLVLISSGVLAAAPGALASIGRAELAYQVGHISPNLRFLTSRVSAAPPFGPPPVGVGSALPADATSTWGELDADLAQVRAQAPRPLRDRLGPARYTAYTDLLFLPQPPAAAGVIGEFRVILAADPHLTESTRLVSGAWPTAVTQPLGLSSPVPIALSVATARRMGWRVGESQTRQLVTSSRVRLVLTGIFDKAQGSDDYWTLNRSILLPHEQPTNNSDLITGTAFVHPASWPFVAGLTAGGYLRLYYPFDVAGVPASQTDELRAQLERFSNGVHPLGTSRAADPARLSSVVLSTGSAITLAAVQSTVGSAAAVLSLLLVGPCGAALAVLAMGSGLLAGRRRTAFALLGVRGAAGVNLRVVSAIEGLLLSLPAAAVGVGLAFRVLPPDAVGPALILPAIAAVLPAALLAWSVSAPAGRPDVATRRAGAPRRAAELAVLAVAIGSTMLLYRSRAGTVTRLDLLILIAPLFLCLAAMVLLTRIFPIPMAAAHRLFRRRPGLVGSFGSARAIRDRALSSAPLLALLLGIAMAVLSATLLTTLQRGVVSAARTNTGADLRVDRPGLQPGETTRIAAVAGVQRVAAVATVDSVTVRISGIEQGVPVYLVDTAALTSVQAGVVGAVPLPAGMTTMRGSAVPVVVSPDLAAASGLSVDGRPLVAVGTSATTAGIGHSTRWILADLNFLSTFSNLPTFPDTLLIGLSSDADSQAVVVRIAQVVADPVIGVPGDAAAVLLAAPVIGGLQLTMAVALVIMGLLCAAAVIMTAVAGAPVRQKIIAILRIIGLPARATGQIVGWELAPIAVVALFGGVGVGIGLSRIVTDVVDLRPFTGGRTAPPVSAGAPLLALLLGGFLLAVTVFIGLSTVVARRAGLATVLRFGDE